MQTNHIPTDEQENILNLVTGTSDNLMINALAGTGKTATLRMIEAASKTKPILFLAFNKKNAEDGRKVMSSTTTVKTFNALGHGIWSKVVGGFKPQPNKMKDLYRDMIDEAPSNRKSKMWEIFWPVVEAATMAKVIGYIPPDHAKASKAIATIDDLIACLDEEPSANVIGDMNKLLNLSIYHSYHGNNDFNDQIYMPTLFQGTFPQFPLIMVDEYQDLNPLNLLMVKKLTARRIIGVGDPNQSIYAFRGAVPTGMADAQKLFNMVPCDLSVSFRCPEAVVRGVHWRVPHFRWSNPGGSVRDLSSLDASSVLDSATFICRNNAPLFSLAMRFLANGRSVSVGGTDIGPRLVRQMKKLGQDSMPRDELLAKIAEWQSAKEDKGSKTAQDTAACMRVFAEHGSDLRSAIAYAEHLFKQEGTLQFTTGHKSKGLEWPTVYHLDPFLLGDNEQELNLNYVISTRSSDRLATINSNDVRF